MRGLAGLVIACVVAGCGGERAAPALPTVLGPVVAVVDAGLARPSPVPMVPAVAPPEIDVVEDVAADAWTVTWRFAEPTVAIVFDRRDPADRHASWQAAPGLGWSLDAEGYEVLAAIDGVARRELTARFATDDVNRGRMPAQNIRFGDGARLLFSGQVGAHAQACDARGCRRRQYGIARTWHLRTAAGRGLRAPGGVGAGTLTWIEPGGDLRGAYLYAGDGVATDDDGVATMIVDGRMPPWLAAETRRRLPALLADHAARTGLALTVAPLVLVSQSGGAAPGAGLRGRALPGQLQLEAMGRGWRRPSRARTRRWVELLAHETFHLWNAHLARRGGDRRDEWLSEGSASFVAGLALRDAGLLTARAYTARVIAAANACLATLHGPLFSEAADPSFYACGELAHVAIDHQLAASGGAVALLAATFARAQAQGSYTTADFRELLAARAPDAAAVARVGALLDVGLGDEPATFVQALLADAGVATRIERGRLRPRRR